MRASLPLLVIAGCGPGGEDLELLPYPTTPVDWSPSPDAVCGVDTPLGSVLLGPWDDAGIGGAAAAGDLDGDGLADLALTVHAAETVLTAGFRVYRGVAGGVEDEAWVGVMGPPETQLGASLAPLGDVDGDGVGDLAVGVQTFETEPSPASVELWLGGAAGLTPASWSAPGLSVAGIDADADGLGDVVVGDVTARQVSLYLGRPGGPSTTFDAISGGDSGFGREVGPAGDLDGDGREEAVTLDDHGDLWILPAGGLDPAVQIDGPGDTFGVHAPADLDGDGYGDLVATWGYQDRRGAAGWYRGTATGLASEWSVRIAGEEANSQLTAAASLGDLDGDGADDLLLGARGTEVDGAEFAGRLQVHPGGPDGPSPEPSFVASASGSRCFFGEGMATADYDGDGLSDVAARVSADTVNGEGSGAVVVVLGDRGWAP